MGRRNRRRWWRWIWIGIGLIPLAGCHPADSREALEVRQRMNAETAELAAELDGLEARLQEDSLRLRLYRELAIRHKRVSALACQNAATQLQSMRKLADRTQRRMAARRLARAQASADPVETRETR